MVAMAKIGRNHNEFKLIDVFKPRLRKPDLEIAETAALAIGIAALAGDETGEVPLLADLALDTPKGREAAGNTGTLNFRVRSFAIYGLGLIAHKDSKTQIKADAFAVMKKVLEDDQISRRDLKVAAINAISILNIGSSTEPDKALLTEALTCLENYYQKDLGAGEQLIQAHCPPAIAKLIGPDDERAEHYKEIFANDLKGKGKVKRSSNDIARSCVLALGRLVKPNDEKDEKKNPDAKYSKLLVDTYGDHKDAQTRNFSLLALGQIGGEQNRQALLKALDKAQDLQKSWAALALGVFSYYTFEQKDAAVPDSLITKSLVDEFEKEKNPDVLSAIAVSLGLSRAIESSDMLRKKMLGSIPQEDLAGYLCIGLALMDDRNSIADIQGVIPQAVRRPRLLQQAAVALGKLGDKSVADQLQKLMEEDETNLSKLSAIASSLGFIGDRRTIDPLVKMLFNTQLGELSRAFAAVALGGVADKEPLPWNSKIAVNMNYRASVETLTNQSGTGILDIL
jgi:HEAT repeat protein